MNVHFTPTALEHFQYWKENDLSKITKIKALLENIKETPFLGIGKPEPLKGNLAGYWSRRITQEHRLVYKVTANDLIIIQCRFHY